MLRSKCQSKPYGLQEQGKELARGRSSTASTTPRFPAPLSSGAARRHGRRSFNVCLLLRNTLRGHRWERPSAMPHASACRSLRVEWRDCQQMPQKAPGEGPPWANRSWPTASRRRDERLSAAGKTHGRIRALRKLGETVGASGLGRISEQSASSCAREAPIDHVARPRRLVTMGQEGGHSDTGRQTIGHCGQHGER